MIKVENASKIYENGTLALDNVSFELPSVGMVAITGASGSGKSTLLNVLSNNDALSSGEIKYNDKNYKDLAQELLIQDFAYIYQDFKLIDNLTVYQNIMIGHELASCKIDYDFVIETAKELGIDELLDEKVYSLSSGQMQRVAIARALVRKPKVIFADEPTGNLDSNNSVNVYNILRKLAGSKLVVVVSHDENIAIWADRIITISDGKITHDNKGQSLNYVEIEQVEKTTEDEEIEEILRLQNAVKSKKVNSFFSYNNNTNSGHKKSILSGKSVLGLSIALINKDIIKKIFLSIVMIILMAFMTLSCAMTFATIDKTMAKAINSMEGQKIFAIKPTIEKNDYIISYDVMQKFDEMLNDCDLNFYDIASGEVIANGFENLYPTNDSIKQAGYFAKASLSNINNAVFTDNPHDIGTDIIIGKLPTETNEIAISKTYYDYLIYYKNFAVDIGSDSYQIEFLKDNLLNNSEIVSIFGVKICGVFDDRNSLDSSLKSESIDDFTGKEAENIKAIIESEYNTNPLINLIIKSGAAKENWGHFSGVNSNVKFTLENCYGTQNSDYYFNYAPLTSAVIDYYNLQEEIKSFLLKKDEIIIDKNTLSKINAFILGNSGTREVKEGDTIPTSIVGMATIGNSIYFPDKTFLTKDITIAKVVDNIGNANNTIIVIEQNYAEFNVVPKFSDKRLIVSHHISASSLKNLNKSFEKYIHSSLGASTNCYVEYSIKNCPITKSSDFGIVYVCQQYICVPLMIVTVLMAVGIIVIFYFDVVKTKAKELLILKSLGVKTYDFLRIYGIFSVVLIALQMLFGLLLGSLLIYLINIFVSGTSGFANMFSVFYLDAASWIFTIFAILVINISSLVISLVSINNKNLRKAFQKLKK